MSDLLTSLQTVSSVKSRIVALENGGPNDKNRARNDSQGREDRPLLEIAQDLRSKTFESSKDETSRSKSTGKENESFRKRHKKVDSTAFIKQIYLTSPSQHDLSDDAREILKSQPDQQDLLAVLQYLQCGIDEQHDFNIRAPSARSSQLTNALVNVTIVDHWCRLRRVHLSEEDKKLKRYLLCCLTSVTGLGALLAQIKKLSTTTNTGGGGHTLTQDMISVLEHVLVSSSNIYDFIENTLKITVKPTQRHVIWQELISLLAGSKILTVVAQSSSAIQKVKEDEVKSISWLGDGPRYCTWLAKNIAHAATTLFVKETEAWSMLAQITRRGFSLGNRGNEVVSLIWLYLVLILQILLYPRSTAVSCLVTKPHGQLCTSF